MVPGYRRLILCSILFCALFLCSIRFSDVITSLTEKGVGHLISRLAICSASGGSYSFSPSLSIGGRRRSVIVLLPELLHYFVFCSLVIFEKQNTAI